jgi:hypothetical protein
MNSGQASDVNSEGISFSAFARIGAAANFTGISNSERGNSGRICFTSLEEAVFLELEQATKNNDRTIKTRCFNGYFLTATNIIFQIRWRNFLTPYFDPGMPCG